MINVFIVDDEYLVRESIKKSLDWTSLGFKIVGEAKDGKQALESIRRLRPDIIIVDINIPFINGIELSKKVREISQTVKIVIVTGYNEFNYAKEAIEAGVVSYILKPVDTRELVQALIKAQKEIEEEKKRKEHLESLEKKKIETDKDRFLNKLVLDGDKEEFLINQIELYELDIKPDNICTAIVIIDVLKERFKEDQEIELWKFAVLNVLSEIFAEKFKSIFFYGPDNQIIIIFNVEDDSVESSRQVFEKIRLIIKHYLKFTLTIGIGTIHSDYGKISISYKDAVSAIKERFLWGFDQVIIYNPDNLYDKRLPRLSYFDREEMLIELRIGNYENIKRMIETVFSNLTREKSTKEFGVFIAMNIAAVAIEFMNENNFDPSEIIDGNILEDLMELETNETVKKYIFNLYSKAISLVFEKKNLGIGRTVDKAKKYIEKYLTDKELSLEKVAESISINSSYLSSIFKQEMGLSVVEYITTCRLNKSKELLDKCGYVSLEQLSEKVGYNDHYYFSKCFKKLFGVTPKKYACNKSIKYK